MVVAESQLTTAEPGCAPIAIKPAAEMVIGAVAVSAPPFVVVAHVVQVNAPPDVAKGAVALSCEVPMNGPMVVPPYRPNMPDAVAHTLPLAGDEGAVPWGI